MWAAQAGRLRVRGPQQRSDASTPAGPAWGRSGPDSSGRLASVGCRQGGTLCPAAWARCQGRLRSSSSALAARKVPVCSRGAGTGLRKGRSPRSLPTTSLCSVLSACRPGSALPSTPLLGHPKEGHRDPWHQRPFPKGTRHDCCSPGLGEGGRESYAPALSEAARLCWKQKGCPSAGSYAEKQIWITTSLQHLSENISDPLWKKQAYSGPWQPAPPLHPCPAPLWHGKDWPDGKAEKSARLPLPRQPPKLSSHAAPFRSWVRFA